MLGLLIFACAQTTPSSDLLTAAPASPVSASYVAAAAGPAVANPAGPPGLSPEFAEAVAVATDADPFGKADAAAEAAAEAAASDPGAVLKLGALPAVLALVASDECVKAQDALQLSLCAALLRTLHTLSEHAPSSAAVCESIVERPPAVAALDSYAAAPAQGAAARHADAVLKAIVRRRQKLARASSLLARQQGHWNDDRGSVSSLRDSVSVHNDAGDAPPVSPLIINKTAQSVSQENPTPPRVLDPFCPAESPPTHNSHEGSELENSNGFARRALLTRLLGGETVSGPSLHLGSGKGEQDALTSGHVSSGEGLAGVVARVCLL